MDSHKETNVRRAEDRQEETSEEESYGLCSDTCAMCDVGCGLVIFGVMVAAMVLRRNLFDFVSWCFLVMFAVGAFRQYRTFYKGSGLYFIGFGYLYFWTGIQFLTESANKPSRFGLPDGTLTLLNGCLFFGAGVFVYRRGKCVKRAVSQAPNVMSQDDDQNEEKDDAVIKNALYLMTGASNSFRPSLSGDRSNTVNEYVQKRGSISANQNTIDAALLTTQGKSEFEDTVLAHWSSAVTAVSASKFTSLYIFPMLAVILFVDSSPSGTGYVALGCIFYQMYLFVTIGLGQIFVRGIEKCRFSISEEERKELERRPSWIILREIIHLRRPIFGAFVTAISSTNIISLFILQQAPNTRSIQFQIGLISAGLVIEFFVSTFPGLMFAVWIPRVTIEGSDLVASHLAGWTTQAEEDMAQFLKITILRLFLEIHSVVLYLWTLSVFLFSNLESENGTVQWRPIVIVIVTNFSAFFFNNRMSRGLLVQDELFGRFSMFFTVVTIPISTFYPSYAPYFGGVILTIICNNALREMLKESEFTEDSDDASLIEENQQFHQDFRHCCLNMWNSRFCYPCHQLALFFCYFRDQKDMVSRMRTMVSENNLEEVATIGQTFISSASPR